MKSWEYSGGGNGTGVVPKDTTTPSPVYAGPTSPAGVVVAARGTLFTLIAGNDRKLLVQTSDPIGSTWETLIEGDAAPA